MKFRASFLGLILAVMFHSCTEIPPFIDFSDGPVVLKDTSYITPQVPGKPPKHALIEDISGVRCVNCPAASETAKQLLSKYGEKVSLITLHPTSLRQYTTPHQGYDTLSTEVAELIMTQILGTPAGLPAGAVNRTLFTGENRITMAHTSWEKYVQEEIALFSPVVLENTFSGSEAERKGVLSIKITLAEAVNRPLALSVFLLESDIISKQSTPDGYEEKYKHIHVLREGITPYNGIKLGDSFVAGRVFEKDFEVSFPPKYEYKNCSFVVLIHNADGQDKNVIQVNSLDI